ncbi:carboxymuconolactone decarboxylase family protein [Anaerocolumna xylanovorans]|uniref:Uncharacterized conserved protein YurZ, alkylhydroperoxidase/carboxymuconolactone decarboxylase family n=1 Tax=Anaerocolumna xylanovorans DSM 12503 TaxID=1121345 RepID=A0A1M7Y3I4_9FIRM|nr:carboxymuconolactone decarboxylase family protein [Anaerocolumna xylanovorans]SHO46688.1 Uncharacterized conserved protein YurZ, alkylhydroperoxidase/carboxymuconolactone decarboxylase family [Anaerocolumna xylanovorans DSM 12503]
MNAANPFMVLKREAPEVSDAFGSLLSAISEKGSLDNKMRQLIFIGIKSSQGDISAVTAHVPMAKQAGATRDEIRDTIIMTLAISGTQGVSSCLVPAINCFDSLS